MIIKTFQQHIIARIVRLSIRLLPAFALLIIVVGSFNICVNIFAANNLAADSVVSIKLTDGTNYRFVVTGKIDGSYTYLMGLDNACAIADVGCVNRDGLTSSTGTVYNASPMEYDNTLSGQEYSITAQTTNFYSLFPESIANATRTTSWGLRSVVRTTSSSTSNGACSISDASCVYSSPVFLASYEEWQGGLSGYAEEPASGSIGDIWCKARYGAENCSTTEIYKNYNFPWLRTADADTTERAWSLRGMSGYSANLDLTWSEGGLLPAVYVNLDDLIMVSGNGNYDNPYILASTPKDDTPDPIPDDPSKPGNTPGPSVSIPDTGAIQEQHGGSRRSMILSIASVVVGVAILIALKKFKARKAKLSKQGENHYE